MKWNNRALLNGNFVSEWQAREQALNLAAELYGSLTASGSTCSLFRAAVEEVPDRPGPTSRRTHLHVGFADDVELGIGLEDTYQMYFLRVPLDTMACGSTPWSCPNFADSSSAPRTTFTMTDAEGQGGLPLYPPIDNLIGLSTYGSFCVSRGLQKMRRKALSS